MSAIQGGRLQTILEVLTRHGVDFIVVGGVAAALRGAPVVTFDLDILHRRTPENVARLLAALTSINARYRNDSRSLTPNESHLMGPGHQSLMTAHGPLDVLGSIGQGLAYEDVLPHANEQDIGDIKVRVLGLRMLLRLKEELGRDKDRAVLDILRRTIDESGE